MYKFFELISLFFESQIIFKNTELINKFNPLSFVSFRIYLSNEKKYKIMILCKIETIVILNQFLSINFLDLHLNFKLFLKITRFVMNPKY